MLVLGIETTCDETACSIVKDGKQILSNVIASQHDIHSKYGGVFPELACRRHVDVILPVITQALEEANVVQDQVDLISVAKGPGLIGALVIGMNAAKGLSLAWNKPFIGVNHVEAHLYAAMMNAPLEFPAIGVVISGGHTFLVEIIDVGSYRLIGTTVDDAIGEAFDKVACMLGFPYPGGPIIEKIAETVNSSNYSFKAGQVKERPWDFSFSGLKTNVLYTIRGQDAESRETLSLSEQQKAEIAYAFQETALSDIVKKTALACKHFRAKAVYVGGGVSSNQTLRKLFQRELRDIPVYWPGKGLSLDNGAMIAGLGYQLYLKQGKGDALDLMPAARLPLLQASL
jgi:N6-L-threonylcarbamoyladenine synthase